MMEEEAPPPIGFRFDPSEQQLIHILRRIILGLPLFPGTPVTLRHVYGGDEAIPWLVFPDDDPCWVTCTSGNENTKTKRYIYAFTQLQSASENRASRSAGCGGTWHGDSGRKDIHNQKGQLIGYWKTYHYRVTRKPDVMTQMDMAGHWIMHEFTLDGVSKIGLPAGLDYDNYVLCRICKDYTKSLKIKVEVKEAPCTADVGKTAAKGLKRKQPGSSPNLQDQENGLLANYKKLCTGESSGGIDGIDRQQAAEVASVSADFDPVVIGGNHPTTSGYWHDMFNQDILTSNGNDDDESAAAHMLRNQSQARTPSSLQPQVSQVEQPYCGTSNDVGVANQAYDEWSLSQTHQFWSAPIDPASFSR